MIFAQVRTQRIYVLEVTEDELDVLVVALHDALTHRNSPHIAASEEAAIQFRAITDRIGTLLREVESVE